MGLTSVRHLLVTLPPLLMVASLLLVGPASAYTAEQVEDGGFVSGSASWTTETDQGGGGTATISFPSSGGQSGRYANLYVSSNGYYDGWANAQISQYVDLTGVDTLTYYVYCDYYDRPGPSATNRFTVSIDGSQKTTTSSPQYYDSWTQVSLDVSSYTGAHTIAFYIQTQGGGLLSFNIDTVSAIGTYTDPTVNSLSASPSSGIAPLTVSFTGTATDGFPTPTYYSWTWGDGTTRSTVNPSTSHTFTTPGTFTVKLEAYNYKSSKPYPYKTTTVTVQEPPPSTVTFNAPRYLSTDTASVSTHIQYYSPSTKTYTLRLYEFEGETLGGLVGTWPISSEDATTQIPVGNYPPGNYIAYLYESDAGIGTVLAYGTAEFSYTVGYYGTVYDAISGDPLSGVSLSFVQGGISETTTSDANGNYAVTGFGTGTQVTVTATKDGYTHEPVKHTPANRFNYQLDINLIPETPPYSGTAVSGIVTDAVTGAPVSGATVTLMGASSASTTTSPTGYYQFNDLNIGTTFISATASGYKASGSLDVTLVENGLARKDIALTPESTSGDTGGYGVQYPPHQVKFTVLWAFGGPINEVSVTATPLESSNPWTWLEDLLGVPGEADVQGTVLRGQTGTDGGITFAMIESVKYRIDIFDPVRGIDTSITIYPKEDATTIYVWPVTPRPESEVLTYDLTATPIDADSTRLTLTYRDTTAKPATVTFYVRNETGAEIYTETQPGSTNLTISYGMENDPPHTYIFGFSVNHPTYGEIKQDRFITFTSDRPLVDLAPWIPRDIYNWAALCIIVLIAAIPGYFTAKFGVVFVPAFAAFFSFIGWLLTPWYLISGALALGVLIYIRWTEGDTGT